ncbi:hypothetical protein AVEN_193204-1 [Araneus ventricosus]|uniref:Uncharacterized protein n=1 Tax=Araneus ventricosus TaxID=182803 RepID=A0A4Y2B0V4_ARAVE|nr:hypothetical protein AVEN_193204-1 [Araneus ventricosus]
MQLFCARTIGQRTYTSACVSSRAEDSRRCKHFSKVRVSLVGSTAAQQTVSANSPLRSMSLPAWFRFPLLQLDAACTSLWMLIISRAGPNKSGAWYKVDSRGLEANILHQNNLLLFAI